MPVKTVLQVGKFCRIDFLQGKMSVLLRASECKCLCMCVCVRVSACTPVCVKPSRKSSSCKNINEFINLMINERLRSNEFNTKQQQKQQHSTASITSGLTMLQRMLSDGAPKFNRIWINGSTPFLSYLPTNLSTLFTNTFIVHQPNQSCFDSICNG